MIRRLLGGLRRAWVGLCVIFTAASLSARALHYATSSLPSALDAGLGWLLGFQRTLTFFSSLAAPLVLVLAGATLVLALVRFRWLVPRQNGCWSLGPWLDTALWTGIACGNALLDVVPEVALLEILVLLPLVVVARSPRARAAPRAALAAAALAVLVLWLAVSPSPVARAYGIAWWIPAVGFACVARRFARARDFAGVLLAGGIAVGFLSTAPTPEDLLDHRATRLGEGRAYSFCEAPRGGRLFAAQNSCDDSHARACRHDAVLEYDLADLSLVRRHEPFRDDFFGRMAYLVCLDGAVLVGMSSAVRGGERHRYNVMELAVEGPFRQVDRLVSHGARPLHDAARGAVYFVEEFSNWVTRWDLGRRVEDHFWLGRAEPGPLHVQRPILEARGSLQTDVHAFSERRNSLFFAEWMRGSTVYEIDRDSLETVAEHEPHNGGTFSLSVDDERGRLLLAGLWGIDVIDLQRGAVVARRRTELGARLPVVDARRGLVYVPAMFGHRLHVFDRDSFARLGEIVIGRDARNAYLSRDGRHLFASNGREHFYWDAEVLARRILGR